MGCLGVNVSHVPVPAGTLASISNHRPLPSNVPAPKSSSTRTRPLVTVAPLAASVGPIWPPAPESSHNVKRRSARPSTGEPFCVSFPWYVNSWLVGPEASAAEVVPSSATGVASDPQATASESRRLGRTKRACDDSLFIRRSLKSRGLQRGARIAAQSCPRCGTIQMDAIEVDTSAATDQDMRSDYQSRCRVTTAFRRKQRGILEAFRSAQPDFRNVPARSPLEPPGSCQPPDAASDQRLSRVITLQPPTNPADDLC